MEDGTEALVAVKANSEELRLIGVSKRGGVFDWSEYTRDPVDGWITSSTGTLVADGNLGAATLVLVPSSDGRWLASASVATPDGADPRDSSLTERFPSRSLPTQNVSDTSSNSIGPYAPSIAPPPNHARHRLQCRSHALAECPA